MVYSYLLFAILLTWSSGFVFY